jgi:hypothetical protein
LQCCYVRCGLGWGVSLFHSVLIVAGKFIRRYWGVRDVTTRYFD